jgi:hypothetical protein
MEENSQGVRKSSRWTVRCLMTFAAVCLIFLAYVLSIGPVYYLWARFSVDMTTHATIERFYSPVLTSGPTWLQRQLIDYRDVARLAGYHGERDTP